MKSGRGFHQTCTEVIVNQFRKELVKTVNGRPGMSKEEAASKLPSTMDILLCVKIFRQHPQLAPSVVEVLGDVTNQTISRAALRRKAQIANYQKLQGNMNAGRNKIIKLEGTVVDEAAAAAASAAVAKQVEEANKNLNCAMWTKFHMAKALDESANVASLEKLRPMKRTSLSLTGSDPSLERKCIWHMSGAFLRPFQNQKHSPRIAK